MMIPSIDIQDGRTVQLVGGREQALDAGDPRPLADRFGRVGEVAVVDLDAALGQGDNGPLIESLLRRARCRVGGGIRTAEQAIRWLDAGADSVVIGTAASPELLSQLPTERVMVALDARDGEVVDKGWTRRTGRGVEDRMAELRGLCGGFLVTFVEREGRMQGLDLPFARRLVEAAGTARLVVAGGVRSADEIAALDALGVDVQTGMALYTGALDLADGFLAPLTAKDPVGPWPTIVCDEGDRALGLVWSDRQSVRNALDTGRGVYHSRKRGLWVKGLTSGDNQDLLEMSLDCDRDALKVRVRQHGQGFCHLGTRSCWGPETGASALMRTLAARLDEAPAGSYTRRLLDDPGLLRAKLVEEAGELAEAETADQVVAEAADVLYFASVALARAGRDWSAVDKELDLRSRRITRRPGDAKKGEAS
jgi:phosphoribosylformimino-5-aminoimidazole carboxamide ribotide isomerase